MAATAARSAVRSSSLRSAAAKVISGSRTRTAQPSPPRLPNLRPAAPRILRSPMEMSFGVESLLPMHSATASAPMTSMLSVSLKGYGWLSEGRDETR